LKDEFVPKSFKNYNLTPIEQVELDRFLKENLEKAVLLQLDSNSDRHPVAFYSKTFSPAERNYDIHDRELLAIIRALEAWHHYIQGSEHSTVVLSDHQNLTAHKEAKKLNRQQAQWFLFLSEYDIKLVHTPGKKMIQSDALSQRPNHCPAEDNDNEDMVLLPDNLFINLIAVNLQEKIANIDTMDKDAETALLLLLNGKLADDWTLEKYGDCNILFCYNFDQFSLYRRDQ